MRSALLAIGASAIALLRPNEAVGQARVAQFDPGDPASLSRALQALLEIGGSAVLDVILSDEVVKFFVVDPPAGLTRFSDVEMVCGVRFEELFGFDSAEWRLSADWHARRRFMASAAPSTLLAALAESHKKVTHIEPAFVRSYNTLASSESPQWFVCRYPNWATAARFDGGVCQLVRSSMLDAEDSVLQWLEREALLANQPLERITMMSSAGLERNAAVPRADVSAIAPPRHMQLLSALSTSEPAIA